MRPSSPVAPVAIAAAIALLLGGCYSGPAPRPEPQPRTVAPNEDRDTAASVMIAGTIQTLQRLSQGTPAEQAEILAGARAAYERAPLGGAQLRYALVAATPGHPGHDPVLAQKLLRELVAQPEGLVPVERALAMVELNRLNGEFGLKADYERQGEAQRGDHERLVAAQRRLQAELEENAKLRKQLEEAQAKLDAVADIERNMTERKSGKEAGKP
jgi:hypothetical protein